jgi:CheY-like chemotaxis protein
LPWPSKIFKDGGAATVKIVATVAQSQIALGEGRSFNAAIVDLRLTDGDATPVIRVLSERGIPVVVTTGSNIEDVQPDLSQAVAVLQKPYRESDLIKTMVWVTKSR